MKYVTVSGMRRRIDEMRINTPFVIYLQTVLQPFSGIQNSTSKRGFSVELKYVLRIGMHFHPANCLPYLDVSSHAVY